MNTYYRAIGELILKRPKKIPAIFRLATGSKRLAKKGFMQEDHTSTPPVTVAIRSTYSCNLRCVQCGQWGRRGSVKDEPKEFFDDTLSTDQWIKFIDNISWFKPYLFFTGGEPLVRSDIPEIIKYANKKNLITSLNTNSTLLEEKAEDIVDSGLDYLFCSFDGTPDIDDKIRIGKNSADRAIRGIKAVMREKRKRKTHLPMIQVQSCITEENQYHLFDTANFVNDELDIETWGLVPGVFTTESLNQATSEVYKKEFGFDQRAWGGFVRDVTNMDCAAIEKQIEKIKSARWRFRCRLYPPINYKDFTFYKWFNEPDKNIGNVFCATVYVFAQIQPNGDVATCGSQPDFITGNIRKDNFIEIWNNQKHKQFRAFTKKDLFPSCPRCWALYEFFKYSP